MVSKKLKNIVVELIHADITTVKADVIVNAANNELWMGSGVAGAIKKKGGAEIEREAVAKGPLEPGESAWTKAGGLPHRFVVHAAVMGQDLQTNAGLIKLATRSALECADRLKMGSIVFPALGTGVGGFPVPECAKIMLSTIEEFGLKKPAHLERVIVALFSPKAYDEFVEEFRNVK